VPRAVIACTRGPNPSVGMPTGTIARVASPPAGQTTRCTCYSMITGGTGGISVT
jgi:hypothetical protein